jgi:putative phosphoesterase
MRIGLVSDTHGLLRPEATAFLAGSDHIVHAGDIGDAAILDALAAIAPVTAIRGNVDTQAWAREMSASEAVTLASRAFYVIHDLGDLDLDPSAAGFDMVVFGHSHQPKIETVAGVVYFNPGSAGPRRFKLPITLATVDLSALPLRPEVHRLIA